jgi:NADPH:quinone reductase-like Zn-dependent oxidoreductase
VVSVGSDSQWSIGDRVMPFPNNWINGTDRRDFDITSVFGGKNINGTLREYMLLPDERLISLPRNLTFEESAALPVAASTAVNAFFFGPAEGGKIQKGQTILTQGTGGVSCFAIQIASAIGTTVIATSSSDEKLQFAKSLGATHTINYKTHPPN